MKTFSLINGDKEIIFNFPTNINELNEEYLTSITDNVNISDYHVLVGLVYHETVGRLIIARKQSKKSISSGVTPIFIKAAEVNNDFIKSIKIKNKLIIPSSQIALSQHVIVPHNTLSLDCFIKYLDRDINVAERYNNTYGKEECYLIEFKLVPATDIIGYYSVKNINYRNPYFLIKDLRQEENSENSNRNWNEFPITI